MEHVCQSKGLSGIYGGSRAENQAYVKNINPTLSTMAPTATVSGAMMTLDATADLPILYARPPATIPSFIPTTETPGTLAPTIYTGPFPVVDGETIYVATVAGNGMNAAYGGGYRTTAPTAIVVSVPPPVPPTIYPPSGAYTGVQLAVLTAQTGTIRYTTDGSTPTATSEIFTHGFRITDGMTVKAVADLDGILSTVSSESYRISGNKLVSIPSYRNHVLPYLLEQYKGDNP